MGKTILVSLMISDTFYGIANIVMLCKLNPVHNNPTSNADAYPFHLLSYLTLRISSDHLTMINNDMPLPLLPHHTCYIEFNFATIG